MILFKTFLTLLKRDYKTLLIHFLVFAVFGTLVAVNNAKVSQNIFTDAKINVAVIDHDRSQLSEAVHRYIRDVQHEVDLKTEDPEKINDAVRFELADFALIIPKGFSKDPGQNKPEYISNGHSASAALMDQKISVYIDDVNAYMESGLSQEEAIEKTDAVVRKDVRVDLLSTDQGKDKSFLYYLFAFAAYGLLMVMCESIGMVMSHLQESETRKRIDVSPYGFRRQGRELILGIVVTALICIVPFIAFAAIAGMVNGVMSKFWLYTLNFCFLLPAGVGLAFFVSSASPNINVLNILANSLVLPMCFISGVFITRDLMSSATLKVGRFTPLYWFVEGNELINKSGASSLPVKQFAACAIIQLLFAAVFIAAGLVIKKVKDRT